MLTWQWVGSPAEVLLPIRQNAHEIENELITHPKVEDVAVIGVPHLEFGEEVTAVIQFVAGVDAGEAWPKS